MSWMHAVWQCAAMLVGAAAGYSAVVRYLLRTRGRPAGRVSRRLHVGLGFAFALMLAVGYGLGVWSVHRSGRDVLATPHALMGTVVLLFTAIVTLLGTASASREEPRLTRLHRLLDGFAFLFLAVQMVLGVSMLVSAA
jgi:uncharacterized membrane protein